LDLLLSFRRFPCFNYGEKRWLSQQNRFKKQSIITLSNDGHGSGSQLFDIELTGEDGTLILNFRINPEKLSPSQLKILKALACENAIPKWIKQ